MLRCRDIYNAADFGTCSCSSCVYELADCTTLSVPSDVNIAAFTHILYAFALIDPSTGTIELSDANADETVILPYHSRLQNI